jgi:hypothetical protein
MKIGLLSDSHGNIQYVKTAGQYLKDTAKVDLIAHLGDEEDDADVLKDLGIEILKISGIFSASYHDPTLPSRIVKEIEGIKVMFTHSPELSSGDLRQIRAVFYGHTHIPKIEDKKGVLWVNPGHLCESGKKGKPASFAVAVIESGRVSANILQYADIL